jgi:hypothetical protein
MDVNVRNTVIRRLPNLVETNSRLLGRVVRVLTSTATSSSATSIVEVTASLSELAERGLIRDVSEIIGTVQQFLTHENPVVCYYGLKCLHHLVEAEDLDFDVVVKVLQKKLGSLEDAGHVQTLPPLVQEGIAPFLSCGSIGANEMSAERGDNVQPAVCSRWDKVDRIVLDCRLQSSLRSHDIRYPAMELPKMMSGTLFPIHPTN